MENNQPPEDAAPSSDSFNWDDFLLAMLANEFHIPPSLLSVSAPPEPQSRPREDKRGIPRLLPAIKEAARQQETVAYYSNLLTHCQGKGGSQYFIEGLANKLASELGVVVEKDNRGLAVDFSILRKNLKAKIEDGPLCWKCNEPLYRTVRQIVRIYADTPDRVPICVHLENGVHELEFHTLALRYGPVERYISIFFTEIMNTIDRHGVRPSFVTIDDPPPSVS